jgi:hypothetical protein
MMRLFLPERFVENQKLLQALETLAVVSAAVRSTP